MALDQIANFVRGSTSESVTNSQTTIGVNDANTYPDPTNGNYNLVLWDDANHPRPDQDPDVEIIRVTGRDTTNNTITVSRGQESTTAVSHPSGSALHLSPTSAFFADVASETQLGVTHVQTSEPAYSEGDTWVDPNTGIYRAAYDAGGGGDYHPVPPVTVLEEASTFTESDVTVTHTGTFTSNGSISLTPVWDISTASFTSTTLATQDGGPQAMVWKPDGTQLWEIGSGSDQIYEYDVSTAWDISTASHTGTTLATHDGYPYGMAWKPDGTQLFEIGRGSGQIYEYDVSTAWDISTASDTGTTLATQDTIPTGMAWKPDGTQLWEIGNDSDQIYEYDVSTAWDISTASFTSTTLATQDASPQGMVWKPDGTQLWEIGFDSDLIYEYDVSTAWDISTASFTSTTLATQEASPQGMAWKPDGTKLFEIDGYSYQIYEYDLSGDNASGDALVEWDSAVPADIKSYDLATFQRTLDSETVTIDVEDGNGNVLFSDIGSNFDISTVDTSKEVKLRVNLSRADTANNPTCDYLARRFVR